MTSGTPTSNYPLNNERTVEASRSYRYIPYRVQVNRKRLTSRNLKSQFWLWIYYRHTSLPSRHLNQTTTLGLNHYCKSVTHGHSLPSFCNFIVLRHKLFYYIRYVVKYFISIKKSWYLKSGVTNYFKNRDVRISTTSIYLYFIVEEVMELLLLNLFADPRYLAR